ncbi:MAG: 4Fe-4S dicluster domain-containing protein [Proteobacteria bacterium]|nr:4Fe-4S dicluster domain-containing protein [Pseudomonadota bacterium]
MSEHRAEMRADKGLDSGRRSFLGTSAGIAAATGVLAIAPGIHLLEIAQARPAGELASSKVRWGLLIDTTRCKTECQSCAKACAKENALEPGSGRPSQNSQWLRKIDLTDKTTGREVSLPMMCQHCAEPPCVDVCPTGASMKRADGIVLVDRHICIGCRYCMMACPYQARSFVHEPLHAQNPEVPRGQGCVEGCTLCVHRVDKGQQPACVEACQDTGGGAMLFGDLNDPRGEIAKRIASVASSQVRADLRLDPGVRYQGI